MLPYLMEFSGGQVTATGLLERPKMCIAEDKHMQLSLHAAVQYNFMCALYMHV